MAQRDTTRILILAKQQWGSSNVDGQTLTITFPITFTLLLSIACSNGRSSGQLNPDNNPYNLTESNFVVFTKGSFYYIALGYQQWGKIATQVSSVSTPLSMTLFYAGLIAWYNCTPDSNARFIGISSMSGNTITVDASTSPKLERSYMLIGK